MNVSNDPNENNYHIRTLPLLKDFLWTYYELKVVAKLFEIPLFIARCIQFSVIIINAIESE